MKHCKMCHKSGSKVSSLMNMEEWEVLFEKRGEKIAKLHKKKKQADEYFSGDRFKKESRHLLDFFKKYAKDSGNVPACN
ncbi:hypothetical protein [Nitrosophilus alvini]|uniref:hypothetical protein n=1 Tax=Nitrosophilus alvini TaxID=2714855 RepID=UPI0019092AA6|nr:hypothetical protein [Nitrosophilus alvini]